MDKLTNDSNMSHELNNNINSTKKVVSRWLPTDDLELILAVQQTKDIQLVFNSIKFSSRFTLQELQERWYQLMYNVNVSKSAQAAINDLPAQVIQEIKARVLWSQEEEEALKVIESFRKPSLNDFQEILKSFPNIFYYTRTAQSLLNHWKDMRRFYLLNDQKVDPSFFEILQKVGSNIDDQILSTGTNFDDNIGNISIINSEISEKEQELNYWKQMISKNISNNGNVANDNDGAIALLRASQSTYLIKHTEVLIGRQTNHLPVDIDISDELPSKSLSKIQAAIRFDSGRNQFFLSNLGKAPISVDGRPLNINMEANLVNGSLIRIGKSVFDFIDKRAIINQEISKTTRQMPPLSSLNTVTKLDITKL